MTDLEYVLASVPLPELLAQTAEEAIELAHAAMKLRRTLDSSSPTPVSATEAAVQMEEEIADLALCLELCLKLLGYDDQKDCLFRGLMDFKLKRWASRLHKAEEGDTNGEK